MSETTGTTLSGIERLHELPLHLLMTCHHHLRHSLTVVDDKQLTRQIHKNNAYLTPVVGIDGAGRIEHGDALLGCKTASRSHLCLITFWQRHIKPRRHHAALQRFQFQRLIKIGPEVHSR